jgi:HJR/Mrr/RecB family endonuclease
MLQNQEYWRGKIRDMPNGLSNYSVYAPCTFAGDEMPELDTKLLWGMNFRPHSSGLIMVNDINMELLKIVKADPRVLYQLSPRKFEEYVAHILERYGYCVELTGETRDGGYDIFCLKKNDLGQNESMIVECKKQSPENKVGVSIVRGLLYVKEELKVERALIATTSTFTKGVEDIRSKRYDLHLADLSELIKWTKQSII